VYSFYLIIVISITIKTFSILLLVNSIVLFLFRFSWGREDLCIFFSGGCFHPVNDVWIHLKMVPGSSGSAAGGCGGGGGVVLGMPIIIQIMETDELSYLLGLESTAGLLFTYLFHYYGFVGSCRSQ